MRIAESSVSLASQHLALERHVERESLRMWVGAPPRGNAQRGLPPTAADAARRAPRRAHARPDSVSLSAEGKVAGAAKSHEAGDPEAALEPKLALLKRIVEWLTGRKIKLLTLEELQPQPAGEAQRASPEAPARVAPAPGDTSAGFGLAYDYYAAHYEAETTSLSLDGIVRTKDGQEIAFSLDLTMRREFFSEQALSVRAGDAAKDPLIIAFDGTAAELTDLTFRFDLDVDGEPESVPLLARGSGFLVLDRNGDGRINDGGELFGPRTGGGFAELAAYDGDQNGWIDEDDAVYGDLGVWTPSADGPGALASIADRGVGAIYLQSVATPFDLRDAQNGALGRVRSSGLYLSAQGTPGAVQQVDLVV